MCNANNGDGKTWTVYVHVSPSNKKYVGITSRNNLNDRWRNGKGYSHNQHFQRAIKKYGWENFEHKILAYGLPEDVAKQMEKDYIKKYNSFNSNYGYNKTLGGDGAVGQQLYGKTNPFYGKHHTEEIKRQNSERMKIAWKENKNLQENISKPVYQFSMNGDYLNSFNSIREAELITGVPHSVISRVCKGKLNYTHGYTWAYQEKDFDFIEFKNNHLKKLKLKHEKTTKRNQKNLGKPLVVYDLSGNIVGKYNSASEASIAFNVHKDTVAYACRNGNIMQQKYRAKYLV